MLAYTGWGQFWEQPDRYRGQDVMGRLHFPGFSPEAVEFLVDERKVRGVGMDTHERGPRPVARLSGASPAGQGRPLRAGKPGPVEQAARRGFYLFVAPMKIETGSGGPTRVFAVAAKGGDGS